MLPIIKMVIIMRKYTIMLMLIGIILGFITGIYLYKINKLDINKFSQEMAMVEDECTEIAQLEEMGELDLLKTNSEQEKVSPNCTLILKVYYNSCKHLIETKEKISQAEVNLTEQELRNKFQDWEVQKFTPTEIVLYKEMNEFCNQHFLLKEQDGYIGIYKLNEDNSAEFFRMTEISTEYLAEEDLKEIKGGIEVYTEKELNKVLEDFE